MNSWTAESDESRSPHGGRGWDSFTLRRAIATDAGREKIITLEEIYQADLDVAWEILSSD